MGIHGLLAQIGPGQRISLAKLSAQHYTSYNRPLRLAIDISIWLFQIQSGKGGSNPALRTFYYRLLRLLSLNIWPLFVFDGPNKPLFKRNKKVGGPGVRVASVPEFLAKQLLKQFGFPWHVAPGEAEAECALLQREDVVDAVLSEDVDTLMFGSRVTLRNWTSENTTKSPTHVNVYRAEETKEKSGLDREGMILVALMSGGDYLPEGIPGCGPKVACDAARAGFGRDLCALSRRDAVGMQAWKDRLQHQIRTNEAKYFSRRNTNFTVPEDFPNLEVLGYYTHPCVSTPDKLVRLKEELRWDQAIDFTALRGFTADAFDWRCLGGAQKFIKNLAPALLLRELRLLGNSTAVLDQGNQEELEKGFVTAIHGRRNHSTTDGELEYRITFIPLKIVPIDLSLEEEDDQFVPAGGGADESDAESEAMNVLGSTQDEDHAAEVPTTPSKKRTFKPFDPTQPEKLWILKPFLQIGCPLLVEDYEASFNDPKEFLKARHKARAATKSNRKVRAPRTKKPNDETGDGMRENTLMAYAKVTKPGGRAKDGNAMKHLTTSQTNSRRSPQQDGITMLQAEDSSISGATFKLPSSQIPAEFTSGHPAPSTQSIDVEDLAVDTPQARNSSKHTAVLGEKGTHPFAGFTQPKKTSKGVSTGQIQRTPKRSKKRPSPELISPAVSQRTITSYYSPSPRKAKAQGEVIDLISSSPPPPSVQSRPLTPSPPNTRFIFRRENEPAQVGLPDTVTKRRRKEPLKRWQTEPLPIVDAVDDDISPLYPTLPVPGEEALRAQDIPVDGSEFSRPNSQQNVHHLNCGRTTEQISKATDLDLTPKAQTGPIQVISSPPASPGLGYQDTGSVQVNSWLEHVDSLQQILSPTRNNTQPQILDSLPLRLSPYKKDSQRTSSQPTRRSPRLQVTRKRIELRESLEGWWREVDAEVVDMSGDGSGWKKSGGNARILGASGKTWRKSGVEVLDLTGA